MTSQTRIVGRSGVLDELGTVLDPRGPVDTAVIRGDPGMGKTTVLETGMQSVPGGSRVYWDAARELQQEVPYSLIADLFELRTEDADPLRASLGHLIMGRGGSAGKNLDPYANVLAITDGLADLLLAETANTPVVAAVDDLHWADRPSLLVLDRLVRRATDMSVRIIIATRPTIRADVAQVLERVRSVGGLFAELGPLNEDEVAEILRVGLGGEPGPNVTMLGQGAAGNPLYLSELCRSAIATGDLILDGGIVDLPLAETPLPFRAVVLERIAALAPDTRIALRAAATLGNTFDVALVATLIHSEHLQVLEALRPAILSGLLVADANSVRFRHELVREALYQEAPASVRRQLHRDAAAAMQDKSASATHLEAAGPPYSDGELDLLRTTAEDALRVDGRRAARLFEVVLENSDPTRSTPDGLRARHALALVMAGDLDEATAALESLKRDGLGTDMTVGLAMLEVQGARDQPDPELVATLQSQLSQTEDETDRLEMFGVIAYHAARADPDLMRSIVAELPPDAPHLPLAARIHFLLARATHAGINGDLFAAVEAAQRAHQLARDQGGSPLVAIRAALVLGVFGGDLEPFRADAIVALEDAALRSEDSHQAGMIPITHALLANAYWAQGDWDQGEAEYLTCAAAAEEAAVPRWHAEALFSLSHMAADRGDIEAAEQYLSSWRQIGWEHQSGMGGAGRGWMRPAALEARIAFGAGRDVEAITSWAADLHDPETVPFGKAISAMDLAVAALGIEDRVTLSDAADCMKAYEGAGPPVGMIRPLLLAALDGDVDAASAIAEQARISPVYGFAKMAEIAGYVAREAGDRDAAIRWLQEASDGWEKCGAQALYGRTRASLRALGIRSRGQTTTRPTTGWKSLSDAERRVVAEVAKGLLYREVATRLHISRRTVETHVAAALRKLNLRNRNELAADYWKRST